MEGQSIVTEGSGSALPGTGMSEGLRQPAADRAKEDGTVPRRLEWIAVILFIFSMFVMVLSYSIFLSEEGWALATVAISMATAVVLLISILLSIFAKTGLSRIALGIGIVGLMSLVVAIGIRLMQLISEYHDRWNYW